MSIAETQALNIVFAGTPEFAAKHLQAIYDSHHKVVAVYTQPDRPAGRGKKLMPSAVKVLAEKKNTPVFQPENFKGEEAQQTLAMLKADVMVVVAYGLILPTAILETPRYGCLNVHGSLLPRWRGAAPIQRAIWAGDKFTGISIMQMNEGLDTGDVLLEKSMAIPPAATSATLYEDLAELGPPALVETLDNLLELSPTKQDEVDVTYAKKLSKEEAELNWHLDAYQLNRNVRAFNPWPICWFLHQGIAIKVWHTEVVESLEGAPIGTVVDIDKTGVEVSVGKHNLKLCTIQLPGKKPADAHSIINGKPDLFKIGMVLGE